MLHRAIRVLIVVVATVVLLLGGALLTKHKKQALAAAPRYGVRPTLVRVASARLGDLRTMREYLAVVEPIRTAEISARLTATVEEVLCDESEPVQAGDTLIVLDVREIEESVAAMKAQVEQARADLASTQATIDSLVKTVAYWDREAQRDRTLAEKGAIPGAQAEGTIDRANEARGKLDAARQQSTAIERQIESLRRKQAGLETTLGYGAIRSPFDGVVSHRAVDPGDLATPGKSLIVVEDHSQLRLSFDVPQQDLPQVREGLGVDYSAGQQNHRATLSRLFPSLNAARMLRAEVNLSGREADGLSSGAYLPLRLILDNSKDVTLVPGTAIVESPNGQAHVFVVQDGHLKVRAVDVRGSSGDDVAVDGIQPGEQVVLSTFLGWAQLASGLKVEAIQ